MLVRPLAVRSYRPAPNGRLMNRRANGGNASSRFRRRLMTNDDDTLSALATPRGGAVTP